MDDRVTRPGLPASLADAGDPFAGATTPGRPTAGRPNPAAATSPTGPAATTAGPAEGPAEGSAGGSAGAAAAPPVPCPCRCGCGNNTTMTYTQVESLTAARWLRCEPCGAQQHFGPAWDPAQPGPGTRAAATPTDEATAADAAVVGTGKRTGESFTIQRPVADPVEEEWDRQMVANLARQQREAARDRWLAGLPERWRLPYDEGESLVPQVEDRLTRLASGGIGDHGTSLVCIGRFGSGKTWVAYTYARAAVDRWLLWPQEIQIGTEAEIMEPLALASPWEVAERSAALLKPSLRMLIIDDVGALGTYKNQENRFATWTKVVNWMYEHKRALVLTTNKALGAQGELEKWIGPTAYERLKHMVGKEQVFRDADMRAEMTKRWEEEYQAMVEAADRD